MADRLNPAEKTAAESDYEKKFNQQADGETSDLKQKESAPDATWKTVTKKKTEDTKDDVKKGRFGFKNRRAGKLRSGSAFGFLLGFLALALVYTSLFTPNIILVNIKDMYTNDLSDATIALQAYYWKMMDFKINHSECQTQGTDSNPEGDIKCKLSTMSRAQYQSFQKNGFTVLGTKVREDNLDDSQPNNDKPESRYKVTAILPPEYQSVINSIKGSGTSILSSVASGNLNGLSNQLTGAVSDAEKSLMVKNAQDMLNYMPIAGGDMLWLYAQLSDTNKDQVYSVFNPITGFYDDALFTNRLKNKYDLTRNGILSGQNEQEVDQSFDNAMSGSDEGIDPLTGLQKSVGGIGLKSLGNPSTITSLETALTAMTTTATSFGGLQCDWYSFGKLVMDDAKMAKAHTLARFAMQYLNAADQIKAGVSTDAVVSTLSDNLSQSMGGGFGGPNATDSSMYKSIVYGNPPLPSPYGLLYSEDTFDLIGALLPAWSQIMASASAEGTASDLTGQLSEPPANLNNSDRQYCLGAETAQNHQTIKSDTESKCAPQITGEAPPGWQSALEAQIELGRQSCVVTHYDDQDHTTEGHDLTQPTLKATATQLSPYVAGLFGANALAWAAPSSLLFNSQVKGVAASDAIFAGTGEILGDMAQSRGMEPANVATLGLYLAQGKAVKDDMNEIARAEAKKQPFDVYNHYSFLGSIVNSLSPTYNDKTPLFSSLANSLSLLGSGLKQLNPLANAEFNFQPDAFNPLRFTCPDPEYLSIEITADTACNVRYAMGPQELLAQPDSVLDYMEQSHPDLTQKNIDELQQRVAQADPEGDVQNVTRMLDNTRNAANQPEIDKTTGAPIPNSEYDKFVHYCVNRQSPWGSTDVVVTPVSAKSVANALPGGSSITNLAPNLAGGSSTYIPMPAVSEGASADQDWYTGKKCTEQSEELMNFRAYTMMCAVDGSLAGTDDCTNPDDAHNASYGDSFYTSNYVEFQSW